MSTLLAISSLLLGGAPNCEAVSKWLDEKLESMTPIALASAPSWPDGSGLSGECGHFAEVRGALERSERIGSVELGSLGRHRAAAQTLGPGGSGRFWEVTIAVNTGRVIAGACLETSTVGFRTAMLVRDRLPSEWHALQNDQFVVWSSLSYARFDPEPG